MEIKEIVIFEGDPMSEVEAFKVKDDKNFYLNTEALNEILSYSNKSDINMEFDLDYGYLKSIGMTSTDLRHVMAGVDGITGQKFPETYILIGYFDKGIEINDAVACILGIEAEDIKYSFNKDGEIILLKRK